MHITSIFLTVTLAGRAKNACNLGYFRKKWYRIRNKVTLLLKSDTLGFFEHLPKPRKNSVFLANSVGSAVRYEEPMPKSGADLTYEIAESVIKPDIAFFFDVPVEEAVARVRRRPEERDRYIDMDLQYKLRKEYVDICYTNGGILISTMQSEDECYEIVRNAVKKVLY